MCNSASDLNGSNSEPVVKDDASVLFGTVHILLCLVPVIAGIA